MTSVSWTEFMTSVRRGDVDTVKQALRYRDPFCILQDRQTALDLACYHGYTSMVQLILEHLPNVPRHYGHTTVLMDALDNACSGAHQHIVQIILDLLELDPEPFNTVLNNKFRRIYRGLFERKLMPNLLTVLEKFASKVMREDQVQLLYFCGLSAAFDNGHLDLVEEYMRRVNCTRDKLKDRLTDISELFIRVAFDEPLDDLLEGMNRDDWYETNSSANANVFDVAIRFGRLETLKVLLDKAGELDEEDVYVAERNEDMASEEDFGDYPYEGFDFNKVHGRLYQNVLRHDKLEIFLYLVKEGYAPTSVMGSRWAHAHAYDFLMRQGMQLHGRIHEYLQQFEHQPPDEPLFLYHYCFESSEVESKIPTEEPGTFAFTFKVRERPKFDEMVWHVRYLHRLSVTRPRLWMEPLAWIRFYIKRLAEYDLDEDWAMDVLKLAVSHSVYEVFKPLVKRIKWSCKTSNIHEIIRVAFHSHPDCLTQITLPALETLLSLLPKGSSCPCGDTSYLDFYFCSDTDHQVLDNIADIDPDMGSIRYQDDHCYYAARAQTYQLMDLMRGYGAVPKIMSARSYVWDLFRECYPDSVSMSKLVWIMEWFDLDQDLKFAHNMDAFFFLREWPNRDVFLFDYLKALSCHEQIRKSGVIRFCGFLLYVMQNLKRRHFYSKFLRSLALGVKDPFFDYCPDDLKPNKDEYYAVKKLRKRKFPTLQSLSRQILYVYFKGKDDRPHVPVSQCIANLCRSKNMSRSWLDYVDFQNLGFENLGRDEMNGAMYEYILHSAVHEDTVIVRRNLSFLGL